MERSKIIERMKSRTTTIDQFNYDALSAPPLLSLLSYDDIEYFRRLATSIKYSAKIDYKYSEIDRIMKMRGFVKLGGGTNRVVYRHLELDTIVVKIAIDAVGIKDNPREYENQFYLKPYVTKVFEVSPCGTVGLFERCDQITSREEFRSIASEVFDLLSNWIIGKYIMEDIGSEYFMNYCVRPGFGPVLCDFPYLYELDGNKLYCQIPDENGFLCDGLIDYDEGFNHLYCSKCGAKYKAIELKKAIDNKLIISKEKENVKMKIVAKLGDKVLKVNDTTKQSRKYESRRERRYRKIKENDPVDNILITTTKQKKEEETVTRMNELPEWEEVSNNVDTVVDNNESNTEVVTLDDKYYDDIEDICIATVDYIKNSILKDEDIHLSITLDIVDRYNSNDLLTNIFTDDDIPENYGESDDDNDVSEDNEIQETEEYNGEIIKEIVEQNKDVIEAILDEAQNEEESEYVDDDSEEDELEDAYEYESNDNVVEEEKDDNSSTSEQSVDRSEPPVGSMQVNDYYYKNKHR